MAVVMRLHDMSALSMAARLMPFYQEKARERMSQGGKRKEGVEKIPPLEKAKSRDEAGAAAG